ncbi:hypothetical protein KC317_g23736 [Hortaea werneckii]|nr:hypothetical protein KC317_g23736 [Hortaea werneckii]
MKAFWTKIAQHDSLKRSSHSISVIGESAYVFGGELKPRQPRDNAMHQVKLAGQGHTEGGYRYRGCRCRPAAAMLWRLAIT